VPDSDRYWVISSGREFGPTDLAGLAQWVREGRLLGDTLLRKNDAAPAAASSLSELAGILPGTVVPEPYSAIPGRCANHPEAAESTRCAACRKPLCPNCVVDLEGRLLCGPCKAQAVRQMERGSAAVFGTAPTDLVVALPSEFGVWEFITLGWKVMAPHWLTLSSMFLLTTILTSLLSIPEIVRNFQMMGELLKGRQPQPQPFDILVILNLVQTLVNLLITGALYVGISRTVLGVISGKRPSLGMLFGGFDRFGGGILTCLVGGILMYLGCVCCLAPGILLLLMWLLTFFVMAESPRDFWQCMMESARLTKGYRWYILLLLVVFFLIFFLSLFACYVGVFVAQALFFTTFALVYRFLQAKQGPAA